jgi:hypothetical protein
MANPFKVESEKNAIIEAELLRAVAEYDKETFETAFLFLDKYKEHLDFGHMEG